MTGKFLCEVCYDALTDHTTEVWNGRDIAVCDDCLAPPVGHPCWQELGGAYGVAELRLDDRGEGYLVRLRNGTTIRFRWNKPLRPRRVE